MDMKRIVAGVAVAMAASAYAAQHDTITASDPGSVRELQQRLKDQGHDPGPIDGIMGPRTQAAMDASQQGQASSTLPSSMGSDAASAAAESPTFGPAAPPSAEASAAQSSSDASAQPRN